MIKSMPYIFCIYPGYRIGHLKKVQIFANAYYVNILILGKQSKTKVNSITS